MSKFHATPKPANRREFRPFYAPSAVFAANPVVTAKVGAITYTGEKVGDEFHYRTSKGAEKVARKFTLI